MNFRIASSASLEEVKEAALAVLDEHPDLSIQGWHGNPAFSDSDPARFEDNPTWSYKAGRGRQISRQSTMNMCSQRCGLSRHAAPFADRSIREQAPMG